jgi:hypothetical protein
LCPGEGEGRGWRGAGGRELRERDDELDSLHIGSNQEIREERRKKRRWRETRRRQRLHQVAPESVGDACRRAEI